MPELAIGVAEEFNGCPWNPLAGFIINEVLYDPPAGDHAGDANGDGSREANEDEFIEFYNSGLEIDYVWLHYY